MHEQADHGDTPRFLLADAQPSEGGRVMRVGSDPRPVAIFRAFGKQAVGLETS